MNSINTYQWKNEFTQFERQKLIALYSIPRDVSKTRVVSVSSGVDVVEEDGVSDASLEALRGLTVSDLKRILSGEKIEPKAPMVEEKEEKEEKLGEKEKSEKKEPTSKPKVVKKKSK